MDIILSCKLDEKIIGDNTYNCEQEMSFDNLPKDIVHKILTCVNLFGSHWSSIDELHRCNGCRHRDTSCSHIGTIERASICNIRLCCKKWNDIIKTRYGHYSYL
jgi:hypothetical protein